MSNKPFDPKKVPDQTGRVFFITGGTAGLGAQQIGLIATASPKQIFFTGRNGKRAEEVIATVKKASPSAKVTYLECDNTDLSSVKACAEKFLAQATRLDVLVANAGIMAWDPKLSKDGYEIQFAINHVAHGLFIKLLMPLMEKTAAEPNSDVRIINMSSVAYKTTPPKGIHFDTLKTDQGSIGTLFAPGKWARYGQSKLANLLYARALAKHHPNIMSVAIHPGYIRTDLFKDTSFVDRIPVIVMSKNHWTPVEEGCWNQTWAATTARSDLENGTYYVPVSKKEVPTTKFGRDDELAEKLWQWTEKELEAY